MAHFKTVTTMRHILGLAIVLSALFGCQSTQKTTSSLSQSPTNQALNPTQSDIAFVAQKGAWLVQQYSQQDADIYALWDKQAFIDNAKQRHPEMLASQEAPFYQTVRLKFANQLKSAGFWAFDGIVGDELFFSVTFDNLPTSLALSYQLNKRGNERELVIKDWRVTQQLNHASDSYFAYAYDTQALLDSGFYEYVVDASQANKITETRALTVLNALPAEFKVNPVILNDFTYATLQHLSEPSLELVEAIYQNVPQVTIDNAGFWTFYYAFKQDYEGYKRMALLSSMGRSRLQTNEDLQWVAFAVKSKQFADARAAFLQLIRARPNDVMTYVAYLTSLIEAEQYHDAVDAYNSIDSQFKVKVTKDAFAELNAAKVDAFFKVLQSAS